MKKKSLITRIFQAFRRPRFIDPSFMMDMKCHEIDAAGEQVSDRLGITRERAMELAELVFDACEKHELHTGALIEISQSCKHQNELAFASSYAEFLRKRSAPMSFLLSLGGAL